MCSSLGSTFCYLESKIVSLSRINCTPNSMITGRWWYWIYLVVEIDPKAWLLQVIIKRQITKIVCLWKTILSPLTPEHAHSVNVKKQRERRINIGNWTQTDNLIELIISRSIKFREKKKKGQQSRSQYPNHHPCWLVRSHLFRPYQKARVTAGALLTPSSYYMEIY